MTSQLLFGECATVLRTQGQDWCEVKCDNDSHIGWMNISQLIEMSERKAVAYCLDLIDTVFADRSSTLISLGAELAEFDGMTCAVGGKKFRFSGQAVQKEMLTAQDEMIERISRKLLNAPFIAGGKSPLGLDNSGFIQLVFKCIGIMLPRDIGSQSKEGETIDFINSVKIGDVIFFSQDNELITHVGIVISANHIIHVSGYVRIDKIDHYGIFNTDIEQYTHRLKIIKRLY